MRKTKNNIISFALAVVILFAALPFAALPAKAITFHSQEEAVEWIKARGNDAWWDDVDGAYGCQCVDLVMAYYQYLVGYRVGGNGKDYCTNALPSGWYRDNTPAPGCIAAWPANVNMGGSWTSGGYGNVGLVYAVSGSTVYTVETNINVGDHSGERGYSNAKFLERNAQNAVYIHPDFNNSYSDITAGTYYLRNKSTGTYMTAAGTGEESNISVAAANGSDLQKFTVSGGTSNVITISGGSLRVNPYYDNSFTAGVNVCLAPSGWEARNDQHWGFEAVSGGYIIRNMRDSNLVLDVSGSNVQISNKSGASSQIWELIVPQHDHDNHTASTNIAAIRTTAPEIGNPYYVKTTYGGLNECILINESNGECIPNCVGYAWGRAYEYMGKRPNLSKGNANTFYNYNKNAGYYSYGNTPRAGSIACWDDGLYGHVAFVESVSGDYVTFTESSYGGARWAQKTKSTAQMKFYVGTLEGYIYLPPTHSADFSFSYPENIFSNQEITVSWNYSYPTANFWLCILNEDDSVYKRFKDLGTDTSCNVGTMEKGKYRFHLEWYEGDTLCIKQSEFFTVEKANPSVSGVSVISPAEVNTGTDIGNIVLGFTSDPAGGSIKLDAGQTLTAGTGKYRWTYTPADTKNYNNVTGTVSINVKAAPVKPTIAASTLADGKVGVYYSASLDAAGTAPITWSVSSGTLPNGLSLSGNKISGTPTAAGTFRFTVKATNVAGSDTRIFTVTVQTADAPTYTVSFNSNGGSGTMSNVTVKAGEKLTLPECGFAVPKGKVFAKWSVGKPGDKVDITTDFIITAVWTDAGEIKVDYIPGDVNGNGKIDSNDYALAKRAFLGTYELDSDELMRADIDGSGKLDSNEYAMIKRHCLGTYTIPGAEGK